MTRRTQAAIAAGQPASAAPTSFVGRNDRGAVRPADDRYLADAELDERDRYLLEVTGPDAQQLVAKREALANRLAQLNDDALAAVAPEGFEGSRAQLIAQLTDSATEMPNADYRELLAMLDATPEEHRA